MFCPAVKNPPWPGLVCGPCTTRTGSGGTSSFQPRSLIQRSAWRTKRPPSFCQSWHPTNSGSRSSASRFSATLSRFHSRSAGMRLPRPVGYICQNCKNRGSICSVSGAVAPSSPGGEGEVVSVISSLLCFFSISSLERFSPVSCNGYVTLHSACFSRCLATLSALLSDFRCLSSQLFGITLCVFSSRTSSPRDKNRSKSSRVLRGVSRKL